jgi:hypothetical protein
MTCEEFERFAEMRLHAALDEVRSAALDVHVAGCASCREFERAARGLSALLTASGTRGMDTMDWQGVAERVRAWPERLRRDLRRMALTLPVLIAIIVLGSDAENAVGVGALAAALGVVILGLGLWQLRRLDGNARLAEASQGDLLAFYRRELDAILRRARTTLVSCLLAAVSFGAAAVRLWLNAGRDVPMRQAVFWLGGSLFWLGYALYSFALRRRCLRERSELV